MSTKHISKCSTVTWLFSRAVVLVGVWSKWTSWSECSKTCFNNVNEVGIRQRFRSCNYTNSACDGDGEEQEPCNTVHCPGTIDTNLLCLSLCFSSTYSRYVLCWESLRAMIFHYVLPVNGGWSNWSPWSQCSSECDSGVQTRERFCNSPSPQHGGSSCPGPQIQTRDCNSHPCLGAA